MSANAEIHHYIKNVLQAIISYGNMGGGPNSDPVDSMKKLKSFVYVLAFVQDLVFAAEPLDFKGVIRADLVIQKTLDSLPEPDSTSSNELPEMLCPVKRTTNLSLIFLELATCMRKNSGGNQIKFTFSGSQDNFIDVVAESTMQSGQETTMEKITSELKLASMLLKSDLGAEFKVILQENLSISTRFSLS